MTPRLENVVDAADVAAALPKALKSRVSRTPMQSLMNKTLQLTAMTLTPRPTPRAPTLRVIRRTQLKAADANGDVVDGDESRAPASSKTLWTSLSRRPR